MKDLRDRLAIVLFVFVGLCFGYYLKGQHSVTLGEVDTVLSYGEQKTPVSDVPGKLILKVKKNGSLVFRSEVGDQVSDVSLSRDDTNILLASLDMALLLGKGINPVNAAKEAEQDYTIMINEKFSCSYMVQIVTVNMGVLRVWAISVAMTQGRDSVFFVLEPQQVTAFKDLVRRKDDDLFVKTIDNLQKDGTL